MNALKIKGLFLGLSKVSKAVVTERIITFVTRFVDLMMVTILVSDPVGGYWKTIAIVTPVYLAACALIVFVSDLFLEKGVDITGIEELRLFAESDHQCRGLKNILRKIVRWTLKRKSTIFWVGSWFYLDPDYVTLFLREKDDSIVESTLRITLPSVVLSMIVWTSVYWLAYQPLKSTEWARWLAENL